MLRPGGRLALAAFFTVDDEPGRPEELSSLLETFANGLDIARPVTALTDAIGSAGLTAVRAESIGAHVWPGWDLWLSRWWTGNLATELPASLRAAHPRLLRRHGRTAATVETSPTAGLGRVV
ncbi:hypothetical protein AB5J72_47485 [Streptomyces sp. CG1]|uniref:hypothetical protein n=1 Tax=Streptomyces sp. CG1 TaxID=1287523 RepID=UPI0034E23040